MGDKGGGENVTWFRVREQGEYSVTMTKRSKLEKKKVDNFS